jgi:mycoredoxin
LLEVFSARFSSRRNTGGTREKLRGRRAWARRAIPNGGPDGKRHQVYGADWCGLTYGVPRYFTTSHFEYNYFDIDDDQTAEEFVLSINRGRRRFPIVVIEDCVMTNPTLAELRRVLDQQGMRSGRVPR